MVSGVAERCKQRIWGSADDKKSTLWPDTFNQSSKSRVAVDKWVVSEELHADGASHYHAWNALVATKEVDGE